MKAWALSALALAALGCKDLPEIPAGICGNHVVEPPEDCDGFARDGVPCRPPGSAGECRLDCAPNESGVASQCPSGWGCSGGTVCRPATGRFRASDTSIPGSAWSVLAGDFDGDGRDDIVGLERPLEIGVTKARIHYFDERAQTVATYVSEKPIASPTVHYISSDTRADLAYSFGSIFVAAGERNRTLLPETYPSYFLGSSPARAMWVTEAPVDESSGVAVFARLDSTDGIFVFDPNSQFLRSIVELPAGVDALASDPAMGDLFADEAEFPCMELVVAYRDATELSVYSLCELDPADGSLHWRDEPFVQVVTLEPPVPIEHGLVLADLDGDGHRDVVVGTNHGAYAAYGDGQELATARPFSIKVRGDLVPEGAMPLAAEDITGDGIADFVFPSALVLSLDDPVDDYVVTRSRFGVPWSEAIFGDLNADELLDVACASNAGLDIDLFTGTGTLAVNGLIITTEHPTEHLAVHDLDGDLVRDLAFVEYADTPGASERIFIAFGRTSGGPEPPVLAANLADVEQVATFANDPTSTLANMMVLFAQTGPADDREHVIGLLLGSSDRIPASAIELTTFASDGAVESSTSAALTIGSFRDPNQVDVLVYGLAPTDGGFSDADPEMWMVEDVASKRNGPENIGWNFDERTWPLGGPNGPTELSARLVPADVDLDQIEELLFVAPSEDGLQCIVNVTGVTGETPELELRDAIALELPCYETEVAAVDLDLDGAPEIALLAGPLGVERMLLVLWNDGAGGFSKESLEAISPRDETPNAFTPFRTFEGATALAYVTDRSIRVAEPSGASRSFDDTLVVAEGLARGTGIVGADVNGDGIDDLAVADAGSIRIFQAELSP